MNRRFLITGPFSATEPDDNEYTEFLKWWPDYAATLNQRATLVWQEIAWAGWFARSEVAEGREPSVFPRRGPSE
jgi:hypothetical protein